MAHVAHEACEAHGLGPFVARLAAHARQLTPYLPWGWHACPYTYKNTALHLACAIAFVVHCSRPRLLHAPPRHTGSPLLCATDQPIGTLWSPALCVLFFLRVGRCERPYLYGVLWLHSFFTTNRIFLSNQSFLVPQAATLLRSRSAQRLPARSSWSWTPTRLTRCVAYVLLPTWVD